MNPKLDKVYRQIPHSTCFPHCGKCCGILYPSLAEIGNIKEWCRVHSVGFRDFNMTIGLDCPYLSDSKECIIYPVRPFLCRMMGVSEDLPCPIGLCKAEKMLNHAQSGYLYSAIYLRGKEKPRTEKHAKLVRELLAKGM